MAKQTVKAAKKVILAESKNAKAPKSDETPKVEPKQPKERKFNKVNKLNGVPGLISEKESRKTGTTVQLFNGQQAEMKIENGLLWAAKCKTHSITTFYKSFRLAAHASATVEEWCPSCKKIVENNAKKPVAKESEANAEKVK